MNWLTIFGLAFLLLLTFIQGYCIGCLLDDSSQPNHVNGLVFGGFECVTALMLIVTVLSAL